MTSIQFTNKIGSIIFLILALLLSLILGSFIGVSTLNTEGALVGTNVPHNHLFS